MTVDDGEFITSAYDIGAASLQFFQYSGACGWPTITAIIHDILIEPDYRGWVRKNNLTELPPKPKEGDTIRWYKIKNDFKSNLRRSIPYLIKDFEFFTTTKIPELIETCDDGFLTVNALYLFYKNGSKYTVRACKPKCKDIDNDIVGPFIEHSGNNAYVDGKFLDAVSQGTYDYLMTENCIYRINTQDIQNKTQNIELKEWFVTNTTDYGKIVAFELVDSNTIICATDKGGIKLTGLSNQTATAKSIKKKMLEYIDYYDDESSDGSGGDSGGTGTGMGGYRIIKYDNGIPDSCCFVWVKDGGYYLGNGTTSWKYDPSEELFEPEYTTAEEHAAKKIEYLNSKSNRHFLNVNYIEEADGMVTSEGIVFAPRDLKCLYETNGMMLFGTSNGVKVYTKSEVDGLYGPKSVYAEPLGIYGEVKCVVELGGNIYAITNQAKFRSFDSQDPEFKLKMFLLGMDYDIDAQTDETDIRMVKLTIIDLLGLGINMAKYDSLCGVANSKPTTYAICVKEGSPAVFHTYGNDNRNAAGIELGKVAAGFEIKM